MTGAGSVPLLELRAVRKEFRLGSGLLGQLIRRPATLTAVARVDLKVNEGEIVGLVGESGSGKSTLAQIAVGLIGPSAGRVLFRGRDLAGAPPAVRREFRSGVQMVFQDTGSSLNPRKRVRTTMMEALAHNAVARPARRREAERLLEVVGLNSHLLGRFPHQLSGGQRQRVGIARALAMGPDLLVADEPVASLDVSLQAQIIALFESLRARLGLGILFISHDLALVGHLSDRIAVMHAGRIVEEGPPKTVLRSPAHAYTQALIAAVPAGLAGRACFASR